MHYQLFLPRKTGQDPQHLVDVGLGDHVANVNWFEDRKGPTGQGGVFAAWPRTDAPDMGYFPKRQSWCPAVAQDGRPAGRYWIGFWNDAPPTPDDLKRPAQFDGYWLELGDGRRWVIPKAVLLPQDLTLAEDGTLVRAPQERFREFWKRSEQWYRRMVLCNLDESTIRVDEALSQERLDVEWWDYLLSALALNYRLTPEVASHLKLFNTANRVQFTLRTVEGHVLREVLDDLQQKKTAGTPAGS